MEYRTATGLEALIGYLYLTNQTNRLMELVKQGLTPVIGAVEEKELNAVNTQEGKEDE